MFADGEKLQSTAINQGSKWSNAQIFRSKKKLIPKLMEAKQHIYLQSINSFSAWNRQISFSSAFSNEQIHKFQIIASINKQSIVNRIEIYETIHSNQQIKIEIVR